MSDDELDLAIAAYKRDKFRKEVAEELFVNTEAYLMRLLEARRLKSHQSEEGKVTAVYREQVSFNETGLRKALGARVYNKLTTAKLDRKKLEAALEAGTVDPVLVAEYTEIGNAKPHIRFTEKKEASE